MLLRRLFPSLALVLIASSCLLGQASPPQFPLRDVRPGLKGVGRTIFEGDKIEEFQVEILGVWKNAIAPKRNLILARLSGGPLATTGVIAGMSGSPVYVDGKLLGAVSRSFPLSKEAIAGITPIEEMLSVVPSPAADSAQSSISPPYRIAKVADGSPELCRAIMDESAAQPAIPEEREANVAVQPAASAALRRLFERCHRSLCAAIPPPGAGTHAGRSDFRRRAGFPSQPHGPRARFHDQLAAGARAT